MTRCIKQMQFQSLAMSMTMLTDSKQQIDYVGRRNAAGLSVQKQAQNN